MFLGSNLHYVYISTLLLVNLLFSGTETCFGRLRLRFSEEFYTCAIQTKSFESHRFTHLRNAVCTLRKTCLSNPQTLGRFLEDLTCFTAEVEPCFRCVRKLSNILLSRILFQRFCKNTWQRTPSLVTVFRLHTNWHLICLCPYGDVSWLLLASLQWLARFLFSSSAYQIWNLSRGPVANCIFIFFMPLVSPAVEQHSEKTPKTRSEKRNHFMATRSTVAYFCSALICNLFPPTA